MTQADEEMASKIAMLLDREVASMEPVAAQRLAAAREVALARYEEQPLSVWEPALAGRPRAHMSSHASRRWSALRLIVLVTAVAGALALSVTSQMKRSNIADIDAALLTDELPINAYLDKGFDSWINRVSQ